VAKLDEDNTYSRPRHPGCLWATRSDEQRDRRDSQEIGEMLLVSDQAYRSNPDRD
jgi:hypothetical protein